MQEIDVNLRETEVRKRKEFLIRQLHRMEVLKTPDGRNIEECSLFTLERVYITEKRMQGASTWKPQLK
nr:hypothetical protein [Oceanobacillus caeni]